MNSSQIRTLIFVVIVLALLLGSRTGAEFAIEYQWWKEVNQVQTWITMVLYRLFPTILASLLCWPALLWAHRRGTAFAGVNTANYSIYSKLVPIALLFAAISFVGSSVDHHKVMTYMGSRGVEMSADTWHDPVFQQGLPFYLFHLPFYSLVLRFLFAATVLSGLVFWISGRGWQIFEKVRTFKASGRSVEEFDPGPSPLMLQGATQTSFARILASVGLITLAGWFFLQRYTLLMNQHAFMSGMDFLDENVTLPLRWLVIIAALISIPLVLTARWKLAVVALISSFAANAITPSIVRAVYVRPNELMLEKSYIERHIEATSEAFGLSQRSSEQSFGENSQQESLDVNEHATLVDNIRLWDSRAFADTITQIQALRPYYRFADIDIDRYTIDGKIKQVMLSPREIDVNELPAEARSSWINPHFVYTHGYGVVMSEVNRTTDDGLPVLLIQDAPPEIKIPDIEIQRPEIYYGEATHDPVFVNTDQSEFDYPAGDQNITSKYKGAGGFPINSLPLRLLASIVQADYNILLTGYMNKDSRMMLYRNVSKRLDHLAGFIEWDSDPYLFITDEGRLMWMVDGYTTSDSHPYSLRVRQPEFSQPFSYIRNSVKATVDAYDGTTTLYVFEPNDPIIKVYQNLFPSLFKDHSEMPQSPRNHARYPAQMFQVQADIYRTYHMRDPEVFYNKEDVWEVGKSLFGDTGTAAPMVPTYIVATVPGETEPEFLLMLPFTPRAKDNLIGWMAARCDGEKLGELFFFQMSKQKLVFGPNQIESRINQDQDISKDLSLWNQQGSRVLRGDIIALPVGESFLYVESIYIQAETARMPQLKKVVLAMGNRLIYEDSFEEALRELSSGDDVYLAASQTDSRQTPVEMGQTKTERGSSAVSQQYLRGITVRVRKLRQQARQLARELEEMETDLAR
ncbi:MAG: hypothetical protein CMN58_02815 [Solibacterales bacterium]|nr:hypothetical protein [Bryobacterales bacterium]|tara:strand:+ start:3824 stop:6562 length:2739 start_codon:yes stop_codon:yes gene_type:complete